MPNGSNAVGLSNNPFGGFGSPSSQPFEQAFGIGMLPSGSEGALDVYRMYRSNASDPDATPATGTGPGSYQFTLTIGQNGAIVANVLPVPEPASISLLLAGGFYFLGSRRRNAARTQVVA